MHAGSYFARRRTETANPAHGAVVRRVSCLALLNFPIAFILIAKPQQPVLWVVALPALRAFQIAAPAGALAIVVFRDGEGPATATGDEVHPQPAVALRLLPPGQLQPSSAMAIDFFFR